MKTFLTLEESSYTCEIFRLIFSRNNNNNNNNSMKHEQSNQNKKINLSASVTQLLISPNG